VFVKDLTNSLGCQASRRRNIKKDLRGNVEIEGIECKEGNGKLNE